MPRKWGRGRGVQAIWGADPLFSAGPPPPPVRAAGPRPPPRRHPPHYRSRQKRYFLPAETKPGLRAPNAPQAPYHYRSRQKPRFLPAEREPGLRAASAALMDYGLCHGDDPDTDPHQQHLRQTRPRISAAMQPRNQSSHGDIQESGCRQGQGIRQGLLRFVQPEISNDAAQHGRQSRRHVQEHRPLSRHSGVQE